MDDHLDENRLAQRWSMSPRTLQRWRQDGRGPLFLKLGGRVVYRVSDIEAWESSRVHGVPSTCELGPTRTPG
jgi:predicted DNA-binding transcriptional regulator AlpA